MSAVPFEHRSVLPREVLSLLDPRPGEDFLDGTVGGGGHARLILESIAPGGRLIGLDRDPEAIQKAAEVLAPFGGRVILRQGNFSEVQRHLQEEGIEKVDGLLLDLGVSSYQLDSPERGFSFRTDGPLDMRMDRQSGLSAADVVNSFEMEDLARIFREYGEERWARRIARSIVRERQIQPFESTGQLAELVRETVPGGKVPTRIHPATRVFQALRIFVNGELDHLSLGLDQGMDLLRPGGRMAVISFHSLEDRIVKHFFRREARSCICPPRIPVCSCGHTARVELLTRRGIRSSPEETAENPRARSAVLRGIRRLP